MEELGEKLRKVPLLYRVIGIFLLSAAMGYFGFYQGSADAVALELAAAQEKESTAEAQLKEASRKKSEIASMTAQLDGVKDNLEEIKRILPSVLIMDEILRATQIAANETNVRISSFKPGTENKETGGKYTEMPVALTVEGSYSEVTRFMDALVHFKNLVHVSGVTYKPMRKPLPDTSSGSMDSSAGKIAAIRAASYVVGSFNMVLYRSEIGGA